MKHLISTISFVGVVWGFIYLFISLSLGNSDWLCYDLE